MTSTGTGLLATVRLAVRDPVTMIVSWVTDPGSAWSVAAAGAWALAPSGAGGLFCALAGAASAKVLSVTSSATRVALVILQIPLLAEYAGVICQREPRIVPTQAPAATCHQYDSIM